MVYRTARPACLIIIFLSAFMCCDAQVKKSYAFYFETIRGNFPKGGFDEIISNQNDSTKTPLHPGGIIKDTSIIVIIETATAFIQWQTAWLNKQPFIITAIPLKSIPFHAGFIRGGKEVVIAAAKGNYLFELQLLQTTGKTLFPQKIIKDGIILKGKLKNKPVSVKTEMLRELVPLPAS